MNLLCKADSDYEEEKAIYFLLQSTPQTMKRLLELMEFVGSLKEPYPEITSVSGSMSGLGFFIESDGLIRELKNVLKKRNLEEALEASWIELPATFAIKVGYDNLPLGALDVVVRNQIAVSEDGVYIHALQKGTLARMDAEHLDCELVRHLASEAGTGPMVSGAAGT